MKRSYTVQAAWDAEASVWVSRSDIPGLVIEAATLVEFEDLMMAVGPEMLAANAGVRNERVDVHFRVRARRELAVT